MVKPSGNDATAAAAALVAGEPLFSGVPNMLLCVIGNRKNFSTVSGGRQDPARCHVHRIRMHSGATDIPRMYVARIISGSTP